MKNEIWKDIKNFERWYQVSNLGRVRSLDRTVVFNRRKGSRDYKGKILKQKYHDGYPMVNLNQNKKLSVIPVHRLVAETFLENPNNYRCVNHMDGIRSNNKVENLEWCTHKQNHSHTIENGLFVPNISGILENNIKSRKRVAMIKNNKIIHIAEYSREMAYYLIDNCKIDVTIETAARAIRAAAANSNKSYHGFHFQFIED